MADIMERRTAASNVWAWVLGLIVIAIILWVAYQLITEDEVTPMVAPADAKGLPTGPGASDGGAIGSRIGVAGVPSASIREVVADPGSWVGRPWTPPGEVTAAGIVSDRGLWIDADGSRLLVVLNEPDSWRDAQGRPGEWPAIERGYVLRIERATLHEPEHLGNVSGEVDQRTRAAVQRQRIFAATDASDIEIIRRP